MVARLMFIFFMVVVLTSCYEQTLIINENGTSGNITYKVTNDTAYNDFIDIIMNDINTNVLEFFNLYKKQDIEYSLRSTRGVQLISHNVSSTETTRTAQLTLSFIKVEELPDILPTAVFPVTFEEKSLRGIVNIALSLDAFGDGSYVREQYRNLSPENRQLIDDYAGLISFKFTIVTPGNIFQSSLGEISQDRRTVTYQCTLYDLINSRDDFNFTVGFSK